MSKNKHTPGPWRVEQGTTLVWGNCNPDDHSTRGMGYPIADARINPSGNWSTGPYADEGEANARLIAAAPEMLEALLPFLPAYQAYVDAMQNFVIDGETSAERRFSECERRDSASESAFEELAKVTFEQLAAVAAAIAKAEGREKGE